MSAAAVEAVRPRIDTLVILAKLGFVVLRKLHVMPPSTEQRLSWEERPQVSSGEGYGKAGCVNIIGCKELQC